MWGVFIGVVTALFGKMGKRVLLGAGLGLVSGAATLIVINYYINKIVSSAGAIGDMAAILHIGGMDTAISIIVGAIVVRATLGATKLSLSKIAK